MPRTAICHLFRVIYADGGTLEVPIDGKHSIREAWETLLDFIEHEQQLTVATGAVYRGCGPVLLRDKGEEIPPIVDDVS